MRRALLAALAAILFLGQPTAARADNAMDKQALVMVRVLAYDRLVGQRAGKRVVIGVVRDPANASSRRAADAMAYALRAVSQNLTVAGKPIVVVDLMAGGTLADRLRVLQVSALYLAPGLERELDFIATAARVHACLTFSDRSSYLRHGLAVALGTDGQKRRITISVDLAAAREQGAMLAAELLRVAEVVKR